MGWYTASYNWYYPVSEVADLLIFTVLGKMPNYFSDKCCNLEAGSCACGVMCGRLFGVTGGPQLSVTLE